MAEGAIIAIFFATLFLYPYLIYPVILQLLPELEVKREHASFKISLLFCAFNEAACLPDKIANLRDLKDRYPDLEVLAFDDGSSDDTLDLLRESGFITVVAGVGRQGKAHGMKLLASKASGDVLLFTDANVTLALDAIRNLKSYFADPGVGGVCGQLIYLDATNTATALTGGLYWQLEEKIKSLESRSGSVMGADGSVFALRRGLYPTFPDTVLDDLTVSMAAVFNGKRLIKADDVVAFEHLVAASREEFQRKIRISARAYHTHMHLRPQLRKMRPLDRFKYVSHKWLRWWSASWMLAAVLAALAVVFSVSIELGVASLGVGVIALLLGAYSSAKFFNLMFEMLAAFVATQMGVFKAISGQTFQTWLPAESRKKAK